MLSAREAPLYKPFASYPARHASARPAGAAMGYAPRVLLICALFKLPYRVLRCATAAGAEVFVLGARLAADLRLSAHCKEFIPAARIIDGRFDAEFAREISHHAARLQIDMVLPGDAPATRSLIQIKHLLDVPSFPAPELTQFDALNDKWQFGALCHRLNVPYPRSQMFASLEALRRELSGNGLHSPHIAKPLCLDSSAGCVKILPGDFEEPLSRIFYRPILFQEFVEGRDVGASVYCVKGEVRAFIAHSFRRDTYTTFYDQRIFDHIETIMRATGASGVFNFDMRMTAAGDIVFLECNPRFFFKIAMSMIAGINFLAFGLPGGPGAKQASSTTTKNVRFPKAFLVGMRKPWALERESWDALRFVFADPIPYMLELLGLDKRQGASIEERFGAVTGFAAEEAQGWAAEGLELTGMA
jgi:hypothetical protein